MTINRKTEKNALSKPARSVPFFRHSLGLADASAVGAVLATPFLTSGSVGRKVEDQLRSFFDVPHAKLTNSWTNGAVATLMALGIGPGDEVIVPAMTFIATANVVELVGATPVFVDVDLTTLLIDFQAVRQAITPRTKAVIPVHLYGQMVDVAMLREICRPDIVLIEDCAHAFESRLKGDRPGAHSDAAIFSFYATKNVTCGEGGAVIMRDDALMTRLQQTVLHGMSAGADRRFEGALYRHWQMEELGTKANMPDLLAALLPAQIATVEDRRKQREALCTQYIKAFAGHPGIQLVKPVAGGFSAHHLFVVGVHLGQRDRVLHDLNQAGIGTTVNYRAVHTMDYYARKYGFGPQAFPIAHNWGERTISLPLFPSLTRDDQDYIVENVLNSVAKMAETMEGCAS